MTLIVAAVAAKEVWMVADSAVTGGKLTLREREFTAKIEPAVNGSALIGFSGDLHHATRLSRAAASAGTINQALEMLVSGSAKSDVEFAFVYLDGDNPRLCKISGGKSMFVLTLYLGSASAFEVFQRIRNDPAIPYAPNALKTFICGTRVGPVPSELSRATVAMMDLFASIETHDVGGWSIPYMLSDRGVSFCGYAYAVSDPLFDRIASGSIVPHGTAADGGTSLSVTDLDDYRGFVIYWLQRHGGLLMLKTSDGYQRYDLEGGPSEFKAKAETIAGVPVHLWVGDKPVGDVKAIRIMSDDTGAPTMAIADHGDGFSISAINIHTPFKSNMEFGNDGATDTVQPEHIAVHYDIESETVSIEDQRSTDGAMLADIELADLDRLIERLIRTRWHMKEEVSHELPRGKEMAYALDPRWRTLVSPHPAVGGLLLSLRHPGAGWLGFVLPAKEAHNLGLWLIANAGPPGSAQ
ncbi:hypothetical protein FV226_26290 [Methylobacterium sp. WL12]|uniref:hypothetical protein n=1 Tax=Methylobacterium sp. WL12 TaxID=2603890 RepID=UPI0011CC1B7C|nr:hypothetical protein [Methylobacterium sp. WL12]TXM64586.1 hypothetical protein FV226_26290 [Methylobacterium sp. WL12]